jgi:hypothetical protein
MFLHERLIASKANGMAEWQLANELIAPLPEVNEEERKYFQRIENN